MNFSTTSERSERKRDLRVTNAVSLLQSALGQRALESQLSEEGYDVNLRTDSSTQWFNTLWADNGGAFDFALIRNSPTSPASIWMCVLLHLLA